MFNFSSSIFSNTSISIPSTTKIVFVADLFIQDYVGGAELTSQALIDSCPFEIFKIKSKDVTAELIQRNSDKFWIFGNFTQLNPQLYRTITQILQYSVLEYDYKYCCFRSPEKHFETNKSPCNCHNQLSGKITAEFFYNAQSVWWMSEKQQQRYVTLFPVLDERTNNVLSSVFDDATLKMIKTLRQRASNSQRRGWIILGSSSWVKGFEAAKKWCISNQKDFEIVWNLPYEQLLTKLSLAEGFVYLPAGGDTCPRMVIEAKLLGCKLHLNENVQHKNEEWFSTDDLQKIENHLRASPKIFWDGISRAMNYAPVVSGYTTTYNCVRQKYPFVQSIQSMLNFCHEVCVVDGGSDDGTWEKLTELSALHPQLKIKQIIRDWTAKNHPVFDGMQKACARDMCTGDFCWQMDSDEIVHEDDRKKIYSLCKIFPKNLDVLSLPVIEYWGGNDKVRCDVNPWKWRLSRNKSNITHGIPGNLRRYGDDGLLYAQPGTDGCDMIDKTTHECLPNVTFYTQKVHDIRISALRGDTRALKAYEDWFNQVTIELPCVFHYSWYDLPRKIRTYRDYWQNHWNLLFGHDDADTAANNMFFGVPWSQVSDAMIEEKAKQLSDIGGWVWHRPWNGERTPWITCRRSQPKFIVGESK